MFQVADAHKPSANLVMKVTTVDEGFFNEVLALMKLNHHPKTPNIPKFYNWFISDQLPPAEGEWGRVSEVISNASQFNKETSKKRLYGYLIMENAEGGTLASFFQFYRDNVPSFPHIWYTLDIVIFQLIYTVTALPHCGILHRDLGGSNNILVGLIPKSKNSERSVWCFAVGDIKFSFPRPNFKPILIDYGTANHLSQKKSLKTEFRYTTLRYRAPELIFISDIKSGCLQPWYTTTADLFSIGLTIVEIIVGNFCNRKRSNRDVYKCHPFLRHNAPRELPQRLEGLHESLVEIEHDNLKTKDVRAWARMLRKGFIDKGESNLLARYLWGMYIELGIPNNEIWPGIESTHIWNLMDEVIQARKAAGQKVPNGEGKLFEASFLNQYLSEDQLNLLKEILQYNPKKRPDVIKILQSDLFAHLRAKDQSVKANWTISAKNVCSWPSKT